MSYDQLLKEEDLSEIATGSPLAGRDKDFLFHDPHNCATADHPCRRDDVSSRRGARRIRSYLAQPTPLQPRNQRHRA
ncbi:unnamed protein product [Pleuronectes platessa]|uniref:Uncharacterized protein n=1 Tax=Pleuronectes platessa TaxID=8262 RepID=A0A9N7ZBH2_PLEPL|nr:unnamed protein product [Pleuronectes platessa]